MELANITSAYRGKLISQSYKNQIKLNDLVLDIGCGTGVVTSQISSIFNCNVTGCDVEDYLIREINFKKMRSINKLPFKNSSFDVSMLNDVLHHLDYDVQLEIIKEALRVSDKLLIFEMYPDFIGKFIDLFINYLHNKNMQILYTYRSSDHWKKTIKELGYQVKLLNFKKPVIYPIKHIALKVW